MRPAWGSRQEMVGAKAGQSEGWWAGSDPESRERETPEGEGSLSFLQAPVCPGHQDVSWGNQETMQGSGDAAETSAGLDVGEGLGQLPAPPTFPGEPHPSSTGLPGTQARAGPPGPPEVCGLTRLLPELKHSLDTRSEVSGDCRPDGINTPSVQSHTHHSGGPSSVSNSSAGLNYVSLLSSSGGHDGHSLPDGWRLGLCHTPS